MDHDPHNLPAYPPKQPILEIDWHGEGLRQYRWRYGDEGIQFWDYLADGTPGWYYLFDCEDSYSSATRLAEDENAGFILEVGA